MINKVYLRIAAGLVGAGISLLVNNSKAESTVPNVKDETKKVWEHCMIRENDALSIKYFGEVSYYNLLINNKRDFYNMMKENERYLHICNNAEDYSINDAENQYQLTLDSFNSYIETINNQLIN